MSLLLISLYQKMARREGFEPTLFDWKSAVLPLTLQALGAHGGSRTLDLLLTKQLLYH